MIQKRVLFPLFRTLQCVDPLTYKATVSVLPNKPKRLGNDLVKKNWLAPSLFEVACQHLTSQPGESIVTGRKSRCLALTTLTNGKKPLHFNGQGTVELSLQA